jgi:hypothetical protein
MLKLIEHKEIPVVAAQNFRLTCYPREAGANSLPLSVPHRPLTQQPTKNRAPTFPKFSSIEGTTRGRSPPQRTQPWKSRQTPLNRHLQSARNGLFATSVVRLWQSQKRNTLRRKCHLPRTHRGTLNSRQRISSPQLQFAPVQLNAGAQQIRRR